MVQKKYFLKFGKKVDIYICKKSQTSNINVIVEHTFIYRMHQKMEFQKSNSI